MSGASYQVHLPVFSGPLDLLLHLIEREELDITAVSLATVTEQYLAQVEGMARDRIDHLVDFLVIGARLVLIKSRALLPKVPKMYDDEEEEDPAEALARQLRLYRQFKRVAQWLAIRESHGFRSYLRVANPPSYEVRADLNDITVDTLISAMRAAFSRTAQMEDSVAVAAKPRRITIDGQIKRLLSTLESSRRLFFEDMLSERATLLEVSVTLLAVLELIKRQEATVSQPVSFGAIEIIAAPRTPG